MREARRPYTEEEFEWLKSHADMPLGELVAEFNRRSGRTATAGYVSRKLKDAGITPIVRHNISYTEEMLQWLRENVPVLSQIELTEAFNEKFGENISVKSLNTYVTQWLGLHRDPEVALRNKRANLTCRQPAPIGTIRILWHEKASGRNAKPIRQIKVDPDLYNRKPTPGRTTRGTECWLPYARWLYIQHYGMIPNDVRVIHLDGDPLNDVIENLYAIGPDVNALMARNQWFTKDPDVTLTAIKLCELARLSGGAIRV